MAEINPLFFWQRYIYLSMNGVDLLCAVYGKFADLSSHALSKRGTAFTVSNSPRNRILRTGRAKVSRKAFM